jgi:hypothetical protein
MSARVLRAGFAYFFLVFSAGFAFGVVRVGWAVERFGERVAELAEAPLMLLVVFVSARRVVERFGVPLAVPPRLGVGVLALVLLLACELTVVMALRGMTPGQYLASRDPLAGAVYVVSLLLFALMPALTLFGRGSAARAQP